MADQRLIGEVGVAGIVVPRSITPAASSGTSARPWVRAPFDAQGAQPQGTDGLYLATGYRRGWGQAPRIDGYVWNAMRAVYEPTLVGGPPANGGVRALRDQAFAMAQQGVFLQALRDEAAPSGWSYRWVRTFGDMPSPQKPYALYATFEALAPKPERAPAYDPELERAMAGKTGLEAAQARQAVITARLGKKRGAEVTPSREEVEAAYQASLRAEQIRRKRAVSSQSGSTEADYSFEAWLHDPTLAGEMPAGTHIGVNWLQPAVDKYKADRKALGLPDLPPPQFTGFAGIKAKREKREREEANEKAQREEDRLFEKLQDKYDDLHEVLVRLEASIREQDEAAGASGTDGRGAPDHQRAALERARQQKLDVEAQQDVLRSRKQDRDAGVVLPAINARGGSQYGVMPAGTQMWGSDSMFTRTLDDEPLSRWDTPNPRPRKKKGEDQDGLVLVPSVVGFLGSDAKRVLTSAGLKMSITGVAKTGRVLSQKPGNATRVKLGSVVSVTLKADGKPGPQAQKEAATQPEPAAPPDQSQAPPKGNTTAETLTVPSVVGMTVYAAMNRLSSAGFSAAPPAGAMSSARVLSQNPKGGALARAGARIALVAEKERLPERAGVPAMHERESVTVAEEMVFVPSLIGKTLGVAMADLAAKHLTGAPQGPHRNDPGAFVSRQEPRAGVLARRGTTIALELWAPITPAAAPKPASTPPKSGGGNRAGEVIVPDVRGKLAAEARTLLRGEGLFAAFMTPLFNGWSVSDQSPAPGAPAPLGAHVQLWLAYEPAPAAVAAKPQAPGDQFFIPDMVGMALADARAALGPLQRLEVAQEQLQFPIYDTDRIATQDPPGPRWVSAPAVVVVTVADQDRYGRARSRDEKDVPDVTGLRIEVARDRLHEAGFVPVVTHAEAPGATVGSQDPGGFARRRVGTVVTLRPQPPTKEQLEAALADQARARALQESKTASREPVREVLGWAPMARVVEEEERRAREREELRVKTHDACAELTATARRKLAEAEVALQALDNVDNFIADSGEAAMQNALSRIVKETRARVNQAASDLWYLTLQAEVRNRDSDGPPCDSHQLRLSINKLDASGALINPVFYAVRNFAEGAQMHKAFDTAVGTALLAIATGGLSIAAVGATVWTIGSAVTSTAAATSTTFLAKRRIGQSAMQAAMEAIEAIVKIEGILGSSTTVDDNEVLQIYAHAKSIADEAKEHEERTQEDRDWIEGAGGVWDKLLNNIAAPFLIRDIAKLAGQGATIAWQKFFAAGGGAKPTGFLLRRNLTTQLIEPVPAAQVPAAVRSAAQQQRLAQELVEQIENLRAADALSRGGTQAGARAADALGDLARPAAGPLGLPEVPSPGAPSPLDLPLTRPSTPPMGAAPGPRPLAAADVPAPPPGSSGPSARPAPSSTAGPAGGGGPPAASAAPRPPATTSVQPPPKIRDVDPPGVPSKPAPPAGGSKPLGAAGGNRSPLPSTGSVSKEGIDSIEDYFRKTGFINDRANQEMLQRLRAGHRTPHDLRFYEHEMIESRLYKPGMDTEALREIHLETLRRQGIEYKRGYERELYAPDVVKNHPGEFPEPTK